MTVQGKKIQVWGVGTARTMRVHWMLHELKLPYETISIKARSGETQSITYLDINPKGKIPTLVHEKFVLSEGFAILRYLSNLVGHSKKDSFQLSLEGQAIYDEWASFILMELDATSLYVIRRHRDLEEIYGRSSEAVNSAQKYFERMLVTRCREVDFTGYVWGDQFSEIDILFTTVLDWAHFAGIKLEDKFVRYARRMHSRPAYRRAYDINYT